MKVAIVEHRFNVGITMVVEVDDEKHEDTLDEAYEEAYRQISAEWGNTFAREAWFAEAD